MRVSRAASHADQAGACVGRAADDLQRLAVTGVDGEHLKLVGVGVTLRSQDMRDLEAREAL